MQSAGAAWSSLPPPWRRAFEAAWASWRSGSLGVGAAVTNPEGAILAVGRNRVMDPRDGPGPLAGIPMAHAEMNALAGLPPGESGGGALYTTFEPCLMCFATITGTYHIPRVLDAARDPTWAGLEEAFRAATVTARLLPDRRHLGGPYGALAYVLHLSTILRHDRGPLHAHERRAPALLALAREVADRGVLGRMARDRCSLADLAGALWPDLCRTATASA